MFRCVTQELDYKKAFPGIETLSARVIWLVQIIAFHKSQEIARCAVVRGWLFLVANGHVRIIRKAIGGVADGPPGAIAGAIFGAAAGFLTYEINKVMA